MSECRAKSDRSSRPWVRAAALLVGLSSTGNAPRTAEQTDLGALLAEAESNHPELRALAARRDAAARVPSRMEALPDPAFTTTYTNEGFGSFTLGSTPDASLAFEWIQEVPYPGKRQRSGDVARGELTTAGREIEVARARIRSAIKRLYFDLHRIDRTADVLDEMRKILGSFVESTRARYESGEGPLENVLKAQTELTAIEVDVEMNRQERRAAEAMLASALGRRSIASFGPVRDLPPVTSPDRVALEEWATSISPEIRVLEAMADTEERRVDLSRRNLKPDLIYGAGYSNRGGLDPMVMGTFGIRLPIHRSRKQVQAVAETECRLEAALRDVDRGRIDTAARVRALFAQFDRAMALAPLYAEGLIPQARSTLDAASGSYVAGGTDFLSLLDDALKLLRYEIELERQRVDALQALAGLEEITGTELILTVSGDTHE